MNNNHNTTNINGRIQLLEEQELAKRIAHWALYKLPGLIDNRAPPGSLETAVIHSNPLSVFFDGKKKAITRNLDDIIGLIDERREIKNRIFTTIDRDIHSIREKIINLPHSQYAINEEIIELYNILHEHILNLKKEKRAEIVSCWRDVTRLREDLRLIRHDLEQEKRKRTLLSGRVNW